MLSCGSIHQRLNRDSTRRAETRCQSRESNWDDGFTCSFLPYASATWPISEHFRVRRFCLGHLLVGKRPCLAFLRREDWVLCCAPAKFGTDFEFPVRSKFQCRSLTYRLTIEREIQRGTLCICQITSLIWNKIRLVRTRSASLPWIIYRKSPSRPGIDTWIWPPSRGS